MKRYRLLRQDGDVSLVRTYRGNLLKRDEVIDTLAQLPRSEWPTDEVLAALGIEWYEIEAVDGAREDE